MSEKRTRFLTYFIIAVAACGYFVDIYDLLLFNIVKKESLEAIMKGSSAEVIKSTGIFLFNVQMTGMLIGGILWGILGDKRGRVSVLFGSILLYSFSNIINAFVTNLTVYEVVRLLAGIGLAGELGAGITLVTESMSKEKRGYGTMLIVSFGLFGAVAAALVAADGQAIGNWLGALLNITLANWQVAYLIGGGLGFLLLMLRVGTIESGMFKTIENTNISRGNILMLFNNRERFLKYLKCILVGLPIWYIIGLIVANSEAIWGKELAVQGKVINGTALMVSYIGGSIGDLLNGLLSQLVRSRRKVIMGSLLVILALMVYLFFFAHGISLTGFYVLMFLLGLSTGFWALFVTVAAEQFGTNIRSTVANTTPNFVRGCVPLIMGAFQLLTGFSIGNILSAFIVGGICIGLSLWAVVTMPETFGKDMDYVESN